MIVAKFSGTCPDCRMPIRIGDKLGKHNGRWAHIQCPPRQQPRRFEDPMCRFDAEIQRREQEADQRAEEAKMAAESRLNEEISCQAPNVTRFYERATGRCCLPLGPIEPLYGSSTRETGRRCPKGHFSFLCPKCIRVTFAVTSAPPEEHETFCSTYNCRACGHPVWSDEGLDGQLGEVQLESQI